MEQSKNHLLPPPGKVGPVYMEDEVLRTYSYKITDDAGGFQLDANGHLLPASVAGYKLTDAPGKGALEETLRRGCTKYIPREVLSQEVLDEDTRVVREIVQKGVYPDGTRRHLALSPPWEWDHYQALAVEYKQQTEGTGPSMAQAVGECPGVDYQYAGTPFRAHTGKMNFVSMHSYCAFENGEKLPADRPAELRNKDFLTKVEKATRREKRNVTACC